MATQALGRQDTPWDAMSLLLLLSGSWASGSCAVPISSWADDAALLNQVAQLAIAAQRERCRAAVNSGMMSEMSADSAPPALLFHNISFPEFVSIINNVGAGGDANYFMLPFLPFPLSPLCFTLQMASAGYIHWAGAYLWKCFCRPADLYTDMAAAKCVLSEAQTLAQKSQTSFLLTAVREELHANALTPALSTWSMDSTWSDGRAERKRERGLWGWNEARLQALGVKVASDMKAILSGTV